ncbi:exopolysaccharide production repressor protein [Ensifer adhaerens]|jgi:exopolysaccharide production repressor protein|uniref:exopolysaccharide production repressor protein n=1 Tax=Ensifer TaxID=106591 RepID=UPI001A6179FF|nr:MULTISPECIES: exopolysaccharide production repressor protein [Ensifer]MBK5570203.1 exopolysaccharide production repressor protein [Ensifer sp. SSB1]MBZ7925715.1 exopolysaccharide production repressor protein [Ensifer adhaerens]UAX95147.1 exopolysaccharide production repressor protein [Ensifer adhaerens]UAY02962.1 exopolysaccharide production repressor protein [Ensifer adhaerens]UAY10946.1 exopolysaccharide production repressor protein [Ensifer adhaerens]
MYAPRVLVSMLGALAVFAIVTYFLNGSLASTLIQTILCAVLMQVGYFIAVLYLVWKKAREKERQAAEMARLAGDDKTAGSAAPQRLDRPGHFNR